MSEQNHYTAKDIERYHSGKLSAAEMHALEKTALDDPFLADALEGYHFAQTPEADLTVLQQKLQLRIERENKRRGVFFMNPSWIKVAALFVLFAGSGWLVFQLFSGGEKMGMATAPAENTQHQPATIQAPPTTPDSIATDPNATLNTTTVQTEKKPSPPEPQKHSNDVVILQQESESAPTSFGRLQTDSLADRSDVANQLNEMARENAFLKSETVAKEQKQADKKLGNDTIKNFDVVLRKTDVAADEVVVLNKNRRSAETFPRKRMQVKVDTLEPAEGWTNFDDYIANNLQSPEELSIKPIRGEVELAFEINKNGEPVNITVVKSLCEKCDEEAVRLLKEGPKWKKNARKGKVKIKF